MIDTYTMLYDSLVGELGLLRAAVLCAVLRYGRMSDGVCRAAERTIATRLHLSPGSVHNALKQLVADGYLHDLTPDRRNAPHRYRDTGRMPSPKDVSAAAQPVSATAQGVSATAQPLSATAHLVQERRVLRDSEDTPEDTAPPAPTPCCSAQEVSRDVPRIVPLKRDLRFAPTEERPVALLRPAAAGQVMLRLAGSTPRIVPLKRDLRFAPTEERSRDVSRAAEERSRDVPPHNTPTPPEIMLVQQVCGHLPEACSHAAVVDAVRQVAKRLGREAEASDLAPFWSEWIGRGYRESNDAWLTDWARLGRPARISMKGPDADTSQAGDRPDIDLSDAEVERLVRFYNGLGAA